MCASDRACCLVSLHGAEMTVRSVTLFVGPTAYRLPPDRLLKNGTRLRPPVRRGDLDPLVAEEEPGVLVICDGVFKSAPAVSHAEIARALDAGWQVWGVSSIGAIRAHEMRREGMLGHGWVYRQFARYSDFTDDEMCLLHLPEEPYLPLSVPLVNLRYALEQRGGEFGLAPSRQRRLLSSLRELWFAERDSQRMKQFMMEQAGLGQAQADSLLQWMNRHPIKTIDLVALMKQRPWLKVQAGR
jgi:hypothetical protein